MQKRVRVNLNQNDVLTFTRRSMNHSSEWQRYNHATMWWCLMLVTVGVFPTAVSGQQLQFHHFSITFAAAGYVYWLWFRSRRNAIRHAASGKYLSQDQNFTLHMNSTGIVWRNKRMARRFDWAEVREIEEQESAAFITASDGTQIMIPRHAFENGAIFQSFVHAIERRLAPSCPRCRYDLRGNHTNGCPECGWLRERVETE